MISRPAASEKLAALLPGLPDLGIGDGRELKRPGYGHYTIRAWMLERSNVWSEEWADKDGDARRMLVVAGMMEDLEVRLV